MRTGSIKLVGGQWIATALLSVLIDGTLSAQASQGWAQVSTAGPAPRIEPAMAYDSQRGVTVLFGGQASSTNYFGDTWEFDGNTWTQVSSTGPSPRYRHAMAYDSQRQRTVLCGGARAGLPFSDTWEWNGTTWTQMNSLPGFYAGHAMAYDSQRGRTVMFGGFNSPSSVATWEWDGNSWTQLAGGPPLRKEHAMAYDSQRGVTVLFGGVDPSAVLGDTWEWNGSSWTQVGSTGPSPRQDSAMIYDSQRGVTMLFGGDSAHIFPIALSDTWEWDGSNWIQVIIAGPPVRWGHAMAYDDQRGVTALFGGGDGGFPLGLLQDTWEYGAFATASGFGSGCGSPALALSPIANARPVIGTTAQVSLTNIPAALAFVSAGWSNSMAGSLTLPFSLLPYGMPGCDLLQSAEAIALPVTSTGPGAATFSLPLPNIPGLASLQLYLQGWANAPGVNPANLIVSNGVEWVIGST